MKLVNTPYDDVFRTLLNDCSRLIIPVINEVFGENYTGNEQIIFSPNEHFLNKQDGNEDGRITDTNFNIVGAEVRSTTGNVRAVQTAVCWSGFLNTIRRLRWMKVQSGKISSL